MWVLLTVIWKQELAGSVVIAELQKQTEEMFRKQIQFYEVIIGILMCVS